MKIEIGKNTDSKRASKLIKKFLELNEKSSFNYLKNDSLYVKTNHNSGFSYIYLEGSPSISICLDYKDDFKIIYTSTLDSLEFIMDLKLKSLEKLEQVQYKAYELEEKIREDDYQDEQKKQKFIKKMLKNGWEEL